MNGEFKILLIYVLIYIIPIIIVVSIMLIVLEGVDKKLERTCALYGMEYYHDVGTNCIEEDGTRHSIAVMDCLSSLKRGVCEIKFIK